MADTTNAPTGWAIFDTESNGLFQFKDKVTGVSIPADAPGQPRLAHLNMVLLDPDLEEVRTLDYFIIPDGWSMDTEEAADARKVNGLSDAYLREHGVPILTALEAYLSVIDEGYVLAAFNAQHDLKQMRAELRRAGLDDRFESTPNTCLMRGCQRLKIPKRGGGGGFPKLSDACAYFSIQHADAHTARGDTAATVEIFRKLHAMDALIPPKVHYAAKPAAQAAPASAPMERADKPAPAPSEPVQTDIEDTVDAPNDGREVF